jgi:hypothetical protein
MEWKRRFPENVMNRRVQYTAKNLKSSHSSLEKPRREKSPDAKVEQKRSRPNVIHFFPIFLAMN